MKYIDIKKDAMRLMGILPDTTENDYDVWKIKAYTSAMNNSILRALDRMKSLSLIPEKTIEINPTVNNKYFVSSLSDLKISGEVTRVLSVTETDVFEESFILENDFIKIFIESGKRYFLKYVADVKSDFSDEDEIDVPDSLSRLIPYFIKADLYEEEEPSLSISARNMFENYLKEYADKLDNVVRGVKAVYKL